MTSLIERLRWDAYRDGVSTDVHHNLLDAADALEQARELLKNASWSGASATATGWANQYRAWLRLIEGE